MTDLHAKAEQLLLELKPSSDVLYYDYENIIAIESALQQVQEKEREACIVTCINEKLAEKLPDLGDIAYNAAIDECAAAIRRRTP